MHSNKFQLNFFVAFGSNYFCNPESFVVGENTNDGV